MAEQERKQKRTEGPPSGEGGQPSAKVTEKGKKLKEDMDKLVDEIDDVLEENPASRITADPAVWETINAHHVSMGMTRDQVRLSWGRFLAKQKSMYKGAQAECWTYEKQMLYFDEKELIAIEEK